MSEPVEEKPNGEVPVATAPESPKPKRARKKRAAEPVVEAPAAIVVATESVASPPQYTPEQAGELAKLAIQSTRFGPNPGFLQGQPIELVRAAIIVSMPPEWRGKDADVFFRTVKDPSLLVLFLTYFAAYWNLGYAIGEHHGKTANADKSKTASNGAAR